MASSPDIAAASRSVLNAVAILETFDRDNRAQTLAEISQRLRLPKATVLRHLRALRQTGYLMYDSGTKTYALGPATLTIAQRYLAQYDALLAGRQLLVSLAEQTGETAHIGVLQGRDVVYIDIAESSQRIRAYVLRGDRLPAHCVASGKAILAHLPTAAVESFLQSELHALTRHTIVDPAAFREDLKRTRDRGFALNLGEWVEEVGAVSAPLFAHAGHVIGAIGVAGPISRLNTDNTETVGRTVREHSKRFLNLFDREAAE